jgi:hypothetical protein
MEQVLRAHEATVLQRSGQTDGSQPLAATRLVGLGREPGRSPRGGVLGLQSGTCRDISPAEPNKPILGRRHPGFNGCSLMTNADMNS